MVAQWKRVCLKMILELRGSHMPWSSQAHAPQLPSLCSRVQEPKLPSPRAASTEALSRAREATITRSLQTATTESRHCSSQLEKALLGSKDSAKPNKKERSEENIDVDISFDYLRATNICNLKRYKHSNIHCSTTHNS